MHIKLLADFKNHRRTIEEYKQEWLFDLLSKLEIDINQLVNLPKDLALEYLQDNNVYILDYPDLDAIQVETRKKKGESYEVIGEIALTDYLLKRSEDKKLYYEITIEHWSIFDE